MHSLRHFVVLSFFSAVHGIYLGNASTTSTSTGYRFATEEHSASYTSMSGRFPPGGSSSLGDSFEAEVQKHWGENPNFQYKDQNGAPIGPFAVLA